MVSVISLRQLQSLLDPIADNLFNKNIILSVNYFRLGIPDFTTEQLSNLLLEYYNISILAVQAYSRFPDRANRTFSRFHSDIYPELSTLSKHFYLMYPQYRCLSATHSFVVLGEDVGFYDHIYKSAFGADSIFEYFRLNDFYWLNIGSRLRETCTYLHHVEYLNHEHILHRRNVVLPVSIYKSIEEYNLSQPHHINYNYFGSDGSNIDSDWSLLESIPDTRLDNDPQNTNSALSLFSLDALTKAASVILSDNPSLLTRRLYN